MIDFLSDPSAYGSGIEAVERCETHGAIVFLAGARAYKLKRAVKLPYMDYSTVERRHTMCQAELTINSPLAPMIYLGVCPVVRNSDGTLRLGSLDETDQAVDWLVVMNRFDQSALFSALCDRGALTDSLMRALAVDHGSPTVDAAPLALLTNAGFGVRHCEIVHRRLL